MRIRPRTIVLLTLGIAAAVFLIVQDRVTASGARRYVALQRDAGAGRGTALPIDEVMAPAIRRSVQQGLLWSGLVLAVGGAAAAMRSRTAARSAPEAGRG